MKVKSESEVTQLCPTLLDPMDCSPPGSSAHGIFQARRVLEWAAIAISGIMMTGRKLEPDLILWRGQEGTKRSLLFAERFQTSSIALTSHIRPSTIALPSSFPEESRDMGKCQQMSKLKGRLKTTNVL